MQDDKKSEEAHKRRILCSIIRPCIQSSECDVSDQISGNL